MSITELKDKAFSGDNFTIFDYDFAKESGSFAVVYLEYGDNLICAGCDPLSPKDFVAKNKDTLFLVDFSRTPTQKNGKTVFYAKPISSTKDLGIEPKGKKQSLNGQQLALLYLALSKNLFPKPSPNDLLYEEGSNGSCYLYFSLNYYNKLQHAIGEAYNSGKFSESNSEEDWNNLKIAIDRAMNVFEIDTSKLKVYPV